MRAGQLVSARASARGGIRTTTAKAREDTSTRVLVADCAPTRLGVRIALEGYATICAEASDGDEALRAASLHRPDVCLIGHSIPGGCVATIRAICAQHPETSLVVLADDDRDAAAFLNALRAGAVGFVPAGAEAGQLRRVIKAVVAEEAAVPRSMVLDLIEELRAAQNSIDDGLTLREAEILTMLRHGRSTADIAGRLAISPITVRRHIQTLMQKVGARDRSELLSARVPTASNFT